MGTSFVGLDSVTFPSIRSTGGQYVENTPELSKNQGFANFKFFVLLFQSLIFLKLVYAFST